MRPEDKIKRLESLLERLFTTVGEQQYTLNSRGWVKNERHTDDPRGPQWSKAGAIKHQYEDVEAAWNDVRDFYDGKQSDSLMERLLNVKNLAVQACKVGHSSSCKCLCCQVLIAADGIEHQSARLTQVPKMTLKNIGGETTS